MASHFFDGVRFFRVSAGGCGLIKIRRFDNNLEAALNFDTNYYEMDETRNKEDLYLIGFNNQVY